MKIQVEIEWDEPKEKQWLRPDNISVALHAHCKNTKFSVKELTQLKEVAESGMLPDGDSVNVPTKLWLEDFVK